ncbi:hypothetical protein [Bacillus sp. SD088]|nr:hypothetical protein [Bacillus sp. SD088]
MGTILGISGAIGSSMVAAIIKDDELKTVVNGNSLLSNQGLLQNL